MSSGLTPDMERLWDLTALLRTCAEILLYGALLSGFLRLFQNGSPWPSRAAGAVYTGILLFCFLIPVEMRADVAYILALVSAYAVAASLQPGRTLMRLFTVITFGAVRRIASTVGSAVYIGLSSQIVWPMHESPEPQFWMFVLTCAADAVSSTLLLYYALRTIARAFPNPHGKISPGEFGLLCVPPGVAITTTSVLGELRQILDYGKYSLNIEMLSMVLVLVVYASMIAAIVLFARIRAEQEKRTSLELLQSQMQNMREYITQMERNDERMARLRHDAANHLQTIAALQETGDLEDASAYAKRTYSELVSAQSGMRTGSPVSDVILSEQLQTAKQLGIEYTADFHYSSDLGFDVFDIAVILHNAGQNAIEGAEKSAARWVKVRSSIHHRTFLIEFSNSCTGCPEPDPETGLPLSSKPGEHGIGLRNIRSAASKYSGSVQIEAEAGVFTLAVVLSSPPCN